MCKVRVLNEDIFIHLEEESKECQVMINHRHFEECSKGYEVRKYLINLEE